MSRIEMGETYLRIAASGVIPVIAIEDPKLALPLADALIEGGLPLAEITFRTSAAATVIETIAVNRPGLQLGAGTILTSEDLRRAEGCGATFGLAPGFNPKIVRESLEIGFPFSPGVMTPSDIEGAFSFGVRVLKFFPAGAAGGIRMLNSIAAPYAHLGMKFIPTGGITQDNMESYLELKTVLAIGGTWIATREDIHARRWHTIRDNCRAAIAVVKRLQASTPA